LIKLDKSLKYYKKYKNTIAAPSTFGKSIDQFANSSSPFAISKGKGAYTWDIDGNQYIDTMMALGSVFLGHSNNEVNKSIKNQLKKGISFSLTSDLELELGELINKHVDSSEYVRFGKNGSDVTSAAIRLSRHYSNNDHVLFCGYHAWQDWYISKTSMNGGIPKDISKYSHRFDYNNLKSLEDLLLKYRNKVACIILEPVSKAEPICNNLCSYCQNSCMGFLKGVKKLSIKYKVILIFDEIVTGFRFNLGGYQKIAKIKPDLSCFSKSMANGMPISALVGNKKIMRKSDEIFYSLTFGGEALSLAASITTINIIAKEGVCEFVGEIGHYFMDSVNNLLEKYNLTETIKIIGFPHKSILLFNNFGSHTGDEIRTLWIKLMTLNGVLNVGYFIFSFSHNKKIVNQLLSKIDITLITIKKAIMSKNKILDKSDNIARKTARDIL
jgi:glutamate-1-semialdehyde aminotransferase